MNSPLETREVRLRGLLLPRAVVCTAALFTRLKPRSASASEPRRGLWLYQRRL